MPVNTVFKMDLSHYGPPDIDFDASSCSVGSVLKIQGTLLTRYRGDTSTMGYTTNACVAFDNNNNSWHWFRASGSTYYKDGVAISDATEKARCIAKDKDGNYIKKINETNFSKYSYGWRLVNPTDDSANKNNYMYGIVSYYRKGEAILFNFLGKPIVFSSYHTDEPGDVITAQIARATTSEILNLSTLTN